MSYDGWTYTWENGRQLKSLSNASTSLSFKYNSDGIRTEKTVNGVTTKYTVFGDKVSFETTGSDKIHYSYDASGNLFSMNLNGTEYYYVRNAQGDITGLIDNAGNLVVSYTYDTWGKLISTTGSLASTIGVKNPYRYRGYRYDIETGLYYLQSRYYNPEWGRFVNPDGFSGDVGTELSHNIFIYSYNNPVNLMDSNGYNPMLISMAVGAGIGAIIGIGTSLATSRMFNEKITIKQIGIAALSGAASGAIAGSSATLAVAIIGNGIIGGSTYAALQAEKGEKINIWVMGSSIILGVLGGRLGGQGAFNSIAGALKGMESAAFQIIAGTAKSYTLNNAAGKVISTVASNITVNSAKSIVMNITGGAAITYLSKMLTPKVRSGGFRNGNAYAMPY